MTKKEEVVELLATYFVVGAGAMGMAFVDQVLQDDPQCSVVLVDRYERPGGHWTIAYPFVTLHQPSCAYGVNSMRLGSTDWLDPNELATGKEVCEYYIKVLAAFQRSGRVRWFPRCEGDLDTSTFTNDEGTVHHVLAEKVVDATYMKVEVPAMRPPRFPIVDGVKCVPVNKCGEVALTGKYSNFVVVGGGKTGMDAVLHLLSTKGVSEDRIMWIVPNDSWIMVRDAIFKPSNYFKFTAKMMASLSTSSSSQEILEKLEEDGMVGRIDASVRPLRMKSATVNAAQLELLRSISNVVRLGRITRVERQGIVLEKGMIALPEDCVLIDCSANGLHPVDPRPIFSGTRITLQPVMLSQQVYSSALIAHVDCTFAEDEVKNEICVVNQHGVTVPDFGRSCYFSLKALQAMVKYQVIGFHGSSRLNFARGAGVVRNLLFALGSASQLLPAALHHVEGGGLRDIPPVAEFFPEWRKGWEGSKLDVKHTAASIRRQSSARRRAAAVVVGVGAVLVGALALTWALGSRRTERREN